MRIVFDTNVFISALLSPGVCRKLADRCVVDCTLVCSPVLIEELRRVIRQKLATDPDTLPLFHALNECAEFVVPAPLPAPLCRDADDDWVLATALAGRADCIITGDEDLLVLKKHGDIRILSPRQFIELLDGHPETGAK